MTPEEEKREERRINWPQEIGPGFWHELRHHMQSEDRKFEAGEERMERIEEDLRPIKKMYWGFLGASAVITVVGGLLLYIYVHDKQDVAEWKQETKELAGAIYKQGLVMEKMLVSHQLLELDYRRTVDRIDRNDERENASKRK